jgi:ATP-dependent Clp protease ATP-binding subunit ClpC
MTDGQGNVVDFRNTILIMTSNLGTEYVRKGGAFGFLQQTDNDEERESHDKIEKALKGTFRPEFLNRIDEIIMFSSLTLEQMEKIVDLQMMEIQERLDEYNIKVELAPAARSWLAKAGYDPAFGARPLRRTLQKHIESPLSVKLLSGEFASGGLVMVDVDTKNDAIVFHAAQPATKTKQPAIA